MTQTETRARGGGELLQADRRGEAGGPGADDHHVVFHRSRCIASAYRPPRLT